MARKLLWIKICSIKLKHIFWAPSIPEELRYKKIKRSVLLGIFSHGKGDRALKLFLVYWLQYLACFFILQGILFHLANVYAIPPMHWKYRILHGDTKVFEK